MGLSSTGSKKGKAYAISNHHQGELTIDLMARGRVCFTSVAYAVFLLLVVGFKHNTTKKVDQGKEEQTYLDEILIPWLGNGFSAPNTLSTGFIERVNGNLSSTSCMLIKLGQHITASDQRSSIVKNVSRIFCEHERKINTFHSMKKQKRSNAPVPYYSNSVASFHILLIAGDVEVNPGPSTEFHQNKPKLKERRSLHSSAAACPQCGKPVRRNQRRIFSCVCKDLTHLLCTGITIPKNQNSGKQMDWTCPRCLITVLPFHCTSTLDMSCKSSVSDNESVSNEILVTLKEKSAQLKIMHLNTQSMVSTFNEFQLVINKYPFDVITLSETWLKNNPELLEYVKIPVYQMEYRNRENMKGGGVGMYIRENIKFSRRKDLENVHPDLEHLWIEIPGRNKDSKVLIGAMYRSTRVLSTQEWLNNVEDMLGHINNSWDGLLILTGDMNIDLLNQDCATTRQYNELLEVFHLQQMVQEPTRVSRHSSSLIDHIVTNRPNRITHTGILPCSIVSDHDGIFACANVRIERFKPRYKFIRYMKNFDEQAFVDDLEQAPFSLIFLSDDPDFQLHLLNSILVEHIDRHAPLRRVRLTRPPAPWMKSEEIQLLQADRDRLRKAAHRTHTTAA